VLTDTPGQIETLFAWPTLLGSFVVLQGEPPASAAFPLIDTDLAKVVPCSSGDDLSDAVYDQGWTTAKVVDGRVAGAVGRQAAAFRLSPDGEPFYTPRSAGPQLARRCPSEGARATCPTRCLRLTICVWLERSCA